jgi:hypothetical protein
MIKSVKRTTEKLIGVRFIVSRPFHGLIESSPLAPTDESAGYCHPSASPTFAAKPTTTKHVIECNVCARCSAS